MFITIRKFAGLAFLMAVFAANAQPTDGLVAHYPLDGNALDASGNGHNGQNYGAYMFSDRFNVSMSAFYFNGSGAHIRIPHSDALNQDNVRTVTAWVKKLGTAYGRENFSIIRKSRLDTQNEDGWAMSMPTDASANITSASASVVEPGVGETVASVEPVSTGEWHFMVWTYDPEQNLVSIFVDLELVAANVPAPMQDGGNMQQMLIGIAQSATGTFDINSSFYGVIDDIRIYNRVLSSAELAWIFDPESCGDTCGQEEPTPTDDGNTGEEGTGDDGTDDGSTGDDGSSDDEEGEGEGSSNEDDEEETDSNAELLNAIEAAVDYIEGMDVKAGIANALLAKLNAVMTAVENGNYQAARGALGAFRNQVRALTGKKLSPEDAEWLLNQASIIESKLP